MDRERLIKSWLDGAQSMQRALKQRYHSELGGEQLTMAQMGLLFFLSENQPASSRQIAVYTCTSKSAVTQLIDSLDRLGMVVRHAEPSDRRVVYVSLSKTGTDRMRALQQRRRVMFRQLAEPLSDAELEAIGRIHRKIVDYLQSPERTPAVAPDIRNSADHDKREGK